MIIQDFERQNWRQQGWEWPRVCRWLGLAVWVLGLSLVLSLGLSMGHGDAMAAPLAARISQYPNWDTKPPVHPAQGDLYYPDWFEGTWDVTTTLVDLVSPLAPDIVTPGFSGNQQFLNKTIPFQARFLPESRKRIGFPLGFSLQMQSPGRSPKRSPKIVADRAFNGLNLAKAYFADDTPEGSRLIRAVKVDPQNPNRQITLMRGDRQLVSTVASRAVESPSAHEFVTTEVAQQEFRGAPQMYFNTVETTTAYQLNDAHPAQLGLGSLRDAPLIFGDQVTAVYLSPTDPDFFRAGDRPVALYRYRLEFFPALPSIDVGALLPTMASSNP